ncbi:ubiquitin C-terminal hydrolase 12-like [Hevea brasiliensis]|uniref:ubiquitin C-terminal hydrolase 12-like n=1 Tax=Hevea brasiliensis TaxID=3981 RepID=UPI0025DCEEA9|nr:ubiquitin C-terminal hydrolase 12-like [Hevea brasiliensis]
MAEGKAMCNAAPFKFTWRINEFSKRTGKVCSEDFSAGGCKWRLAIYPKGNKVNYLSIYLEVAYPKNLPEKWSTEVKFSLAVVNQINSRSTVRKDTQKQIVFNASGKNWNWGFAFFIPLSKLKNPSEGYLVGDSLMVEAEVLVYNVQQNSLRVYTEEDTEAKVLSRWAELKERVFLWLLQLLQKLPKLPEHLFQGKPLILKQDWHKEKRN